MALGTRPGSVAPARRAVLGLITAMALVEALSGVTQGYLSPLLPALGPELGIDDPTINGIFLVSNVSFAVLTPIISRLGDSWGCRRVLRSSTAAVALGVLLMAVWPSLWTITVSVVLLTSVVGFIPLMMGILRTESPAHTRTGVGAMIGSLMVSVGIGGLLAGVVGASSPALGLWVAAPFAAVALVCSFLLPEGTAPTREPIAVAPLAACSLGLIGVVTALSLGTEWGWADPRTLACAGGGALLLALWIRHDAAGSSRRRFVDLRLLASPRLRIVSAATFLFGCASISYFGTNAIVLHSDPAQTGYGFGFGPFAIAVVMAGSAVVSFGASLATPRLLTLWGERAVLVASGASLAAGFLVMLLVHHSVVGYCVGFALFSLSLGAYQAATRTLSVEGVPVEETSTAAGLNELALSVGIAVGAAVVKLVSSASAEAGRISAGGISGIWTILALAAVAAAIVAWRYPGRDRAAA